MNRESLCSVFETKMDHSNMDTNDLKRCLVIIAKKFKVRYEQINRNFKVNRKEKEMQKGRLVIGFCCGK